MDRRKNQRTVYCTARQKKKLIELMTKHPELISCKVTQDFNHSDSQKLWQNIANECNSIPGARKTWRKWRKTWQDLRSNTKKRHAETNGDLPTSVVMLTQAEQEVLGLKNVSSTTNYQDVTEFIPIEENIVDSVENNESNLLYSDEDSVHEEKLFAQKSEQTNEKIESNRNNSKHTDSCVFNCGMLAAQEQRKIQIKEDYYSFKKDYLKQKLEIMKEQSEALKSIARKLSSK